MVWRTTIITCTTCFLLGELGSSNPPLHLDPSPPSRLTAGTTFTHWIADHNVLWRSPLTSEALAESIRYYALVGAGPPALAYVYVAVGVAALVASGWKLHSGWRGKGGEVLFDGASLCECQCNAVGVVLSVQGSGAASTTMQMLDPGAGRR